VKLVVLVVVQLVLLISHTIRFTLLVRKLLNHQRLKNQRLKLQVNVPLRLLPKVTSGCQVYYTDADGDWCYENNDWCSCGNKVTVSTTQSCSFKITAQGYKCCPSNCVIYYTDADGTWGVNNDEWCDCGGSTSYGTDTKTDNIPAPYQGAGNTDFCKNSQHTGKIDKVTSNKVGSINGISYELWVDSGNNSATFYEDDYFSCSFQQGKDYLCRSGLSFDSTQTHQEIGHIYAEFRLVKQNIQNVDYSYVGIYGWTREPLVEFCVVDNVDNWLSQWRPGDWVGNKKHGDFTIDGTKYTVFENTRYGPSIDGDY